MPCQTLCIANGVDCIPAIESEKPQTQPPLSPKEEKNIKHEPPEQNSEMQDSKPRMCDVGVSANMTSDARFIMNELNPLQDVSRTISCVFMLGVIQFSN